MGRNAWLTEGPISIAMKGVQSSALLAAKSFCLKSFCLKSFCLKSFCLKSFCLKSICLKSFCLTSFCLKSFCIKSFLDYPTISSKTHNMDMSHIQHTLILAHYKHIPHIYPHTQVDFRRYVKLPF
jgi:hypothetical protein